METLGAVGMTNSIIGFGDGGRPLQVGVESAKIDHPHGSWLDEEGFIYIGKSGEGPKGDRLLRFQRLAK